MVCIGPQGSNRDRSQRGLLISGPRLFALNLAVTTSACLDIGMGSDPQKPFWGVGSSPEVVQGDGTGQFSAFQRQHATLSQRLSELWLWVDRYNTLVASSLIPGSHSCTFSSPQA